ncbi:MAG: 6-phosphogluconolactonase [Chloroflexota bacterium]|nr:6-phosphogluconolactonase [Chloroflexota bacterium]
MADVQVYPDADSLARVTAECFVTLAAEAIIARGRFVVALSGGSTPRATYALLASREFAPRVDWSCVHVFWGDERCVPPDHPDSNYRLARQVLLDQIPISADNIHRIRGELNPGQAAVAYQAELETVLGADGRVGSRSQPSSRGRLDMILLGMGADGHTASLFPGTAPLHEQTRWVVAHYVEKLGAWRVTLTPSAINAARHIVFIVTGGGKAKRLREVLLGPYRPDVLPAQIVRPADGRLRWLVDTAAAIQWRK